MDPLTQLGLLATIAYTLAQANINIVSAKINTLGERAEDVFLIDGARLHSYTVSNLNLVAQGWVQGMEMSLGIYNLFDARYQHPGSRNNWQNGLEQDGRGARAKFIFRF